MKEIKNIAVIGAGAMGSTFVALLHKVPEFSTTIIAKGERYDRLKKSGITVNGETLKISVSGPDENAAPADLILVGLKHSHLASALPDLRRFIDSNTIIVSVMNGLDSEEIIGAVYGMEKMLYCVSVGIDALREGDNVVYTKLGKLHFGHPDNSIISDQVRRVQIAFDRAGIPYEIPVDMMRTMWWKFMLNVGLNQASAVMRAPFGIFQTSTEAWTVVAMLMREVIAVAKSAGVNLNEDDIDTAYKIICTLSPEGKTSMLQDTEANRKTEVDIFAGKVAELGRKYGMPTPVNEMMLNMIRTLEQHPIKP